MMTTLLERFLRYVKIDTQSDETSETYPSTTKQFDLSNLLADECRELQLDDVTRDEFGIVIATIPANVPHRAPAIVWVAHVDTSPEYSGTNVRPIVHKNYDGRDLALPGDPAQVIRVDENPDLRFLHGGTIITSDGTTLLGADDKSGVAVIMSAAAHLMQHPEIPRGPIHLCFTCDEEIGRGIAKLNVAALDAVCGYTLDGDSRGKVDSETFSADQAVVTVHGVNTHPSIGKGVMVNALRIMGQFLSRLPADHLSPETTDGREGFLHPYSVEGGVAEATARIILRDFETAKLTEYADLLKAIASDLQAAHPECRIDVTTREQYRNMGDGLRREPRALSKALAAIKAAGMEPVQSVIRGGTDGSILTEQGLPTPNLSTGEHNPHSPREWTSVEEMQSAVDVLVQLARLWSEEQITD